MTFWGATSMLWPSVEAPVVVRVMKAPNDLHLRSPPITVQARRAAGAQLRRDVGMCDDVRCGLQRIFRRWLLAQCSQSERIIDRNRAFDQNKTIWERQRTAQRRSPSLQMMLHGESGASHNSQRRAELAASSTQALCAAKKLALDAVRCSEDSRFATGHATASTSDAWTAHSSNP